LSTLQLILALVVANRVAGGVIAIQLAFSVYSFPVAVTAYPVSIAQMAGLSRLYTSGAARRFRDELVRGAGLACFIAVPASLAIVVLARPIAHAISFGQMATATGTTLVTVALAATGLSAFGQAVWLVCSFASYARNDASAPLRASVVRTIVVALPGYAIAFFALRGTAVVVAVGVTMTVSTLAGALALALALRRQLPRGGDRLVPVTARDFGASALMLAVAYPIAVGLQDALTGRAGDVVGVVTAVVVGIAVYFGVQRLWRAPELSELRQGLRELRVRAAD
jgi:putative peptidoglycan lipid II flippase